MINELIQIFSYVFVQNALVAGLSVAISCALLGVILVLKRYSMIGDGLSHVAFGSISLAFALRLTPIPFAIFVVVVAAFLLLQLNESSKVKADAAIAILSSTSLAVGVIVSAVSGGSTNDLNQSLFGTILASSKADAYQGLLLLVVVIILFFLFFQHLFVISFDEEFAIAIGVPVRRYKLIISTLTAITVVLGMKIMGAMLISSLIILPALTAMRLSGSFRTVMGLSVIISVLGFLIGMLISFWFGIPSGASIVVVNTIMFLFSMIGSYLKRRISR